MELGPIILFTPEFAESLRFYEAVLGVPPTPSGPGFARFMLAGGGQFALHHRDGPLEQPGPLHLHFTAESLDAVVTRARAAGFSPEGDPRVEPWGPEVGFLDPAGFPVEVTERREP